MNQTAKNLLSFVLLLTLTFLLASCEGDEGPVGPAGPAGPAGEDAEFTIVTISFTGTEAGISGSYSFYGVAVPEITQEVHNNGAILVYMNGSIDDQISDQWYLMPLSRIVSGATVCISPAFGTGFVFFYFTTTSLEWVYSPEAIYTFKIVILSDPVKSGVNVENFEDVRVHCQERLLEME